MLVAGATACSPGGIADNGKLPPGVQDPKAYHTPSGAMDLYRGAVGLLPDAFEKQLTLSGIVTDELMASPMVTGSGGPYTDIDARINLAAAGAVPYPLWHRIRAQAREARGFLETYVTGTSDTAAARNLRGHLYAIEGYADVFLADLFCSGIPLSTMNFDGDYTFAAGSKTQEVYAAAAALFDSALALSSDSVQFRQLAAVGRGRTLLAVGRYADAATAVAEVPDNFKYQIPVQWEFGSTAILYLFVYGRYSTNDGGNGPDYTTRPGYPTVGDREGTNGLDYRSSNDPRTGAVLLGQDFSGHDYFFPQKYHPVEGPHDLTLASGVEARLIEAEASLQAGDVATWLAKLNQLRTDGTGAAVPADTIADTLGVTGCGGVICGDPPGYPGGSAPIYGQPPGGFPVPAGYSLADSFTINPVSDAIRDHCYDSSWYEPCYVDLNAKQNGQTTVYLYVKPSGTAWNAGTGGVAGLGPLVDPGTPEGRVDLMFRERAFWLYLTAHRQGDLRRLIRQYGRPEGSVYPSGSYPGGNGTYGTEIVAPVPASELELNPKYAGCFGFGA